MKPAQVLSVTITVLPHQSVLTKSYQKKIIPESRNMTALKVFVSVTKIIIIKGLSAFIKINLKKIKKTSSATTSALFVNNSEILFIL